MRRALELAAMPAWRIGPDMHLCPFPGAPPHGAGPTAVGAPTVLINGFPAARAGDFVVEPVGGPDIILLGCPTVMIGWQPRRPPFHAPRSAARRPVAHSSFELATKGSTQMEPWYGGIAEKPDFQIGYPASWSAESRTVESGKSSLVDVRLLDAERETLLGYLQVRAEQRAPGASVPAVEKLQADTLAALKAAGLVPRAAPELLSEEQDPRAIEAADWLGTFVCDGMMKGGRVLVRMGFLDRKGQTFSFTAIGPLVSDDVLTALRTQRAFEIARATLVMP